MENMEKMKSSISDSIVLQIHSEFMYNNRRSCLSNGSYSRYNFICISTFLLISHLHILNLSFSSTPSNISPYCTYLKAVNKPFDSNRKDNSYTHFLHAVIRETETYQKLCILTFERSNCDI